MTTVLKPRIVLDTTVINHLEDGREGSEPLMRGLELGYDVRLPAMVVDEILATKSTERRDALLRRLARFLSNSKCIWPPNEVLRLHVQKYHQDPSAYDWNRVNVRAREYEQVVSSCTLPDELFAEQRSAQFHLQNEFEQGWTSLRPKLDEIIERDPKQRLNSFEEAAEASTKLGGVLWGFGIGLFKKALEGHVPVLTDEQIKPFIDACPPFRAVCYSFVKGVVQLFSEPRARHQPQGRTERPDDVGVPALLRQVPHRRLRSVQGLAGHLSRSQTPVQRAAPARLRCWLQCCVRQCISSLSVRGQCSAYSVKLHFVTRLRLSVSSGNGRTMQRRKI